MSLVTLLALAFGLALVLPFLVARTGQIGVVAAALLPAVLFGAFVGNVPVIAAGGTIVDTVRWVPSLGIDIALRLDGLSLLFALLITGIGTFVTLYAGAYMDSKPAGTRARFLGFILLFMAAMLATVLSDNLVVMFVFWEMTSLLSFLLVGFETTSAAARRAALQSLLVTAGGGLALLAGVLLIGVELGTFTVSEVVARGPELVASPLFPAIAVLVMIGAFTKSAQIPFHFWLPNAMQAPTAASAYLHSATMVKLGIYLLARLDPAFSLAPWVGTVLVVVGGVTMLTAALQALRSVGFKAVLAYSTVASLGTLVMLIGLDGPVAAVAIAGFILAHALYKATLFFCAGTVIHATGETRLRSLGGLARVLPFTAAATLLASFSMAGMPPFLGFISKEYFFEAKLEASVTAVAIAVGVLVNAVMVAVAGVVALRPFFGRARAPLTLRHGETPGLLAGPLALGLFGVVLGLAPALVAGSIIQPAAGAIHGAPIDVSFKLWHGLTPMLALSALVVAIGGLIAWRWDPIHIALRRVRSLDELLLDRGYDHVLGATLAVARGATRTLQNGDLRTYGVLVAGAVTVTLAIGVATAGSWDGLLSDVGPLSFALVVICALIILGAVLATHVRSLIGTVVAVGLAGFGLGLVFLMNGGPDLALTQFAVETLFMVIVTAVLLKLPISSRSTRTAGERTLDGAIAVGFGAVVFVAMLSMAAKPFDRSLTDYFAAVSLSEAYGRNVVNVILVDFRALDTLGEIAVVGFAALAAWALLGAARRGRKA